MTTPFGNDDLPSSPPKRRKLKHPRTPKACAFCRKRKVRCSGTHPCDYCQGEGIRCEYVDALIRPRGDKEPASPTIRDKLSLPVPTLKELASSNQAQAATPRGSRRNSADPPQAFAEGQHIGPTSGVSLLYHLWNRVDEPPIPSACLTSHGDFQLPAMNSGSNTLPPLDEANALLERYFRFATPTYRFLHRPTLEAWTTSYVTGEKGLSVPKAACVLLACAQSLLYSATGERYQRGDDMELQKSRTLFEKAKTILDQEPGPASLASVQARLAKCLYLASSFRITECRFSFSFACEILTSLGLHRKASTPHRLQLIELESRRRTFWCAYVLDGYLSIILGRPRLLRDEDIDQPYPRNFDDQDLMSSESAEDLPMHGNLEAFVAHADLAKLMARNSDLLYPLRPLTEEQILGRTNEMIVALDGWKNNLPEFLKPREKTLAGQRTFERQNTVLKLAYAHQCILATRRCLLIDFTRLSRNSNSQPHQDESRIVGAIYHCIKGMSTIINATCDLMEHGGIYQAFWFTQYISLVAISTLYVLLIQIIRNPLPGQDVLQEVEALFGKAKMCQQYLADIAPEGSQAKRHHKLLDQLRTKAEKDLARGKWGGLKTGAMVDGTTTTRLSRRPNHLPEQDPENSIPQDHNTTPAPKSNPSYDTMSLLADGSRAPIMLDSQPLPIPSVCDPDSAMMQFTPSDDLEFQNLLGWGWESLDTLGFPIGGEMFYDGLDPLR